MPIKQNSDKSNAAVSKPARDLHSPSTQPPIRSPLLNDGPELLRDSHC
jgi:hypothetical protein